MSEHKECTKDSSNYPFRIFLSYARGDINLVEQIAAIIKSMGHEPLWDRAISPGTPFTESIKALIERSHLFVPVITENSQNRPWVHQETGYAIALNIPVLPLAIGQLPAEMIAYLQGISICEDLSDLREQLENVSLKNLVMPKPAKPPGTMRVAEWPETRTELIIRYTNWVLDMGHYGYVRHQGAWSSFSIPDRDLDDSIWRCRAGRDLRSDHFHYLLREERRVLEHHAREKGCSLIVDPETTAFTTVPKGPKARWARLQILLEFFSSAPSDKPFRIVFSPRARKQNLIMVGDYFFAEAFVPKQGGYHQTMFNSHPPTVFEKLCEFDQEFDRLYKKCGVSVDEAVARIQKLIDSMPDEEKGTDGC